MSEQRINEWRQHRRLREDRQRSIHDSHDHHTRTRPNRRFIPMISLQAVYFCANHVRSVYQRLADAVHKGPGNAAFWFPECGPAM